MPKFKFFGKSKPRDPPGAPDEQALVISKKEPAQAAIDPLGCNIIAHPAVAKAIIIFIHGLTGGSASTWTKDGLLWPKEHLARDIPDAIIVTFGYDADVVGFFETAGSNTINSHATSLANGINFLLRDTKRSDGTLLPVYICAHSLGGLVAEKAYLQSRDHDLLRTVFEQVQGMIFFGTPHRGSGSATMGLALGNILKWFRRTNTQLLCDLRPHADILSDLADQFQTEQRQSTKRLDLRYIHEEVAVRFVGMIVEKDSAVVPGYPCGSIHADHMNITKILPDEDSEYAHLVVPWLKDLVAGTPQSAPESPQADKVQDQSPCAGGPTFKYNGQVRAGKVIQGINTTGHGTTNLTF